MTRAAAHARNAGSSDRKAQPRIRIARGDSLRHALIDPRLAGVCPRPPPARAMPSGNLEEGVMIGMIEDVIAVAGRRLGMRERAVRRNIDQAA